MIAASIFIASMVATVGTGLDLISLVHGDGDHPGERRGDVAWVVRIGTLGGLDIDLDRLVAYPDRSQLAVDRAHHRTHAALIGVADGR